MAMKKYILPLLFLCVMFPAPELSDTVRFSSEGLDMYHVKKAVDSRGRETFTLSDLTYQDAGIPFISDLVLSLNRPSSQLVRDDSGKYMVRYAQFDYEREGGALGGGGARFYKADHRIEIEPSRSLWLGSCGDMGSFTIEFRLLPGFFDGTSMLFACTGFASGKKSGIEIVLRGRRVVARLYRVFRDSTGRRIDVMLNRGRALDEGQWSHYSLSFDRISGKIVSRLNGEEQEVAYVTIDGAPFNGVFEPTMPCEDLPIAVIGKNYTGILDEFRISYRHADDLKKETDIAIKNYRQPDAIGREPVNREGVLTSPVYAFPLTGTRVIEFGWEELLNRNSHVWTEFRISDDLFDRNDQSLKWYRIDNHQRNIYLKKAGDLYLRGKYYQWRMHFVPSPDGTTAPVVRDVALHYQLDRPPKAPLFVETTGTGDAKVRLRWKKNVEHDIFGYRVYYGIRPGKYDGVISTVGGSRITNASAGRGNYVEVELTNNVIAENYPGDAGVLTYPLLKNNVLYFFAVSAYDSYRPDTRYNHESEFSKEVTARPLAGSEINN